MPSFSQRYGYSSQRTDIVIREDAPDSLRVVVLQTAAQLGLKDMRGIVCRVLRKRPDSYNWSPENIWGEVQGLVYDCEWFRVYNLTEEFQLALYEQGADWKAFETAINECFVEEGIGWQLIAGNISIRGDDAFQRSVNTVQQLNADGRPTAASHIQWALKALSERPKANTPGAVSHATSAVESLLSDITGEAYTLGKYLDRYPSLFHPSLKKALDSLYGYASDAGARHGKEGVEPNFESAQFIVATCAATCTLLNATNPKVSL